MIRPITSVKVSGRRVLVRAGFDVPLKLNAHTERWMVADDTRIKDALPTIKHLVTHEAKVIIASHLDRPKDWESDKSLLPVAEKLGELLSLKVIEVKDKLPDYNVPHVYFLSSDITKKDYSVLSYELKPGDILFLENLRFYSGEQDNDESFVSTLAKFADVFVNEAFSTAHRKEASTFGIAKILPSYAGIDLLKEIKSLSKAINNPKLPMVLLMGGAKIVDKIETLEFLGKIADHILLGGAVANTFLKVLGYNVGKSDVSDELEAKHLLRNYKNKIVLPVDLVVARSADDQPRLVNIDKVRPEEMILDVGPESIRKFSKYIKEAKTLVWNGPFGLIEKPKFAFGSKSLALAFASRSKGPAYGLVGGGETVEVINVAHVRQFIDHVSTGGGAMLEFLAGKKLPAIKALEA